MSKWIEGVTLTRLLLSIGIAVAAIVLLSVAKKLYGKFLSEKASGDQSRLSSVSRIVFDLARAAILVVSVLAILDVNGVNVTSLIAGLGLASAMIGLALQDGLKDVIMGTHILVDDFYKVGDIVRYGDFEGTVVFFNTRTTKIQNTLDGRILTVCNRNVSEITKLPDAVPVILDLPLSYDEDAQRVHALLTEIAARIGQLAGVTQSEYKGTQRFGESAIVYRLCFFCDPAERFQRERDALRAIQDGLAEARVVIPYNQLDVHQR